MPTDLHIALQEYYAGEGGETEVAHGRYKLDAVRDGVAYEIRTANFFKIRDKIEKLAKQMPVVVVYPIAETKTIVRVDAETGEEISKRRSPKRGGIQYVFPELRHIAGLLASDNVNFEICWTAERELRTPQERNTRYHRRVSLVGRELVEVIRTQRFATPEDWAVVLPANLPRQFSVADLAQSVGISKWSAGHMFYSLRTIGAIVQVGKRGNAYLYEAVGEVVKGEGEGWLEVRCSECGLVGMEAQPGSVIRWRCSSCKSLQTWAAEE